MADPVKPWWELESEKVLGPTAPNTASAIPTFAPTTGWSTRGMTDIAMNPDVPAATTSPTTTKTIEPTPLQRGGYGAAAGLQAGMSGQGATDETSAIAKTLLAGASGAAAGSLAGPPGAIVGGAVGLASGALESWLSIRDTNKQKAAAQKLAQEQQRRADKQAAQDRHDQLEQLGYNRKEYEKAKAVEQYQNMMKWISSTVQNNDALRQRWVATGAT